MVQQFLVGDRAPPVVGAALSGRFYSLDAQAGRPAVFIALGGAGPQAARQVWDRLGPVRPMLQAAGVDVTPLAPALADFAAAFEDEADARDDVVYVSDAGGLEALRVDGAPAAVFIDRGGRIVHVSAFNAAADLAAACGQAAPRLTAEPSRLCATSAPVLMIPNLITPACCEALIAHFEASAHGVGVIASIADGRPYAKLDEAKKHRRETELTADAPLHGEILGVFARRCAPELKRAFQADIAHADRILIARYDDAGGYFKRHRDNAAPHTAFREFAISINLNTGDYEGGALLFPEYDDHRYSPPAGGALIFSASLLHEAAPVTRGSRYVLLSFFSSAAAGTRMVEAA